MKPNFGLRAWLQTVGWIAWALGGGGAAGATIYEVPENVDKFVGARDENIMADDVHFGTASIVKRVRIRLADGREGWGVAAESLAAKWFDKDPALSDAQVLDAMMAHPILINRPIVVTPEGVRLCRPSEDVLDLLPPQRGAFVKEDGERVIDEHGRRVATA